MFLPLSANLWVLNGHDDTGGQNDLLPGLADVKDVDAILVVTKISKGRQEGGGGVTSLSCVAVVLSAKDADAILLL